MWLIINLYENMKNGLIIVIIFSFLSSCLNREAKVSVGYNIRFIGFIEDIEEKYTFDKMFIQKDELLFYSSRNDSVISGYSDMDDIQRENINESYAYETKIKFKRDSLTILNSKLIKIAIDSVFEANMQSYFDTIYSTQKNKVGVRTIIIEKLNNIKIELYTKPNDLFYKEEFIDSISLINKYGHKLQTIKVLSEEIHITIGETFTIFLHENTPNSFLLIFNSASGAVEKFNSGDQINFKSLVFLGISNCEKNTKLIDYQKINVRFNNIVSKKLKTFK